RRGFPAQAVKSAVALVERRGEFVDLDEVAQVERHQGGAAAGGADPVIGLLEPADRAPGQYEMGAFLCKALRHRGAEAARGAGDQRDLAGKPARHQRGLRAARRSTAISATMLSRAVNIK